MGCGASNSASGAVEHPEEADDEDWNADLSSHAESLQEVWGHPFSRQETKSSQDIGWGNSAASMRSQARRSSISWEMEAGAGATTLTRKATDLRVNQGDDDNGAASMSAKDFAERMGAKLGADALEDLFDALDINLDGKVTIEDFILASVEGG
ncbi:hypothetical protein T484DRAFT_1883836, partial [Baffinella frigidus]